MKALQVKRNSVRSLLRRGLVILSILALAFAFMGCNDSSGSGGGNNNGGGQTPTPQRTVQNIEILAQPTGVSYQGLPPNLSGVIARVTWSDGVVETVSDAAQFQTVPTWAEWAYNSNGSASAGTLFPLRNVFRLQHVSGGMQIDGLTIPQIVAIEDLHVTGVPAEWYADESPVFTGLRMTARYQRHQDYRTSRGNNNSPDDKPSNWITDLTREITFSPIFPRVDLTDAFGAASEVKLVIGPNASRPADYPDRFQLAVNGGAADGVDPEWNWANAPVEFVFTTTVHFPVATELAGGNFGNVFDDDVDKFFTINPLNDQYEFDYEKTLDVLEAANASFRVFYSSGRERTLNFREYRGNMQSMINRIGTFGGADPRNYFMFDLTLESNPPTTGMNSQTGVATGAGNRPQVPIIATTTDTDTDETTIDLWLQYGLFGYNDPSVIPNFFDVRIPVLVFGNEITVSRRSGALAAINILLESSSGARAMSEEAIKAINERWQLQGIYERGRDRVPRDIPFEAWMFGDDASPNNVYQLTTSIGAPLNSPEIDYEVAIHVWYRGEIAAGEEGIEVNVARYDFPQPNNP